MLAIFFKRKTYINAIALMFFLLFASPFFFSQSASGVESITENEGLTSNYIFGIAEDQNNFIWLGSDKGLLKYEDGKWISFNTDNGMPGNYINKIWFDGKNGLYLVIAEQGIFHFNTNNYKIDLKIPRIIRSSFLKVSKGSVKPNFTLFQFSNSKEDFAVLTGKPAQIFEISEETSRNNQHQNLVYAIQNGRKILISAEEKIKPQKNTDFNGFHYTFEYGKGIYKTLNGKVLDTINENHGLKSNSLSDVLKTSNGDLYFSSLGGGLAILRKYNSFKSFPMEHLPLRQIVSDQNKLYLLAEGFIYEVSDEKIVNNYKIQTGALSLLVDGDMFFVGTFGGLFIYKNIGGELKLVQEYKLPSGVSSINKQGAKIVMGLYGGGISTLEKGKLYAQNSKNYPFVILENLFKINHGYIATSYERGLFSLNDDLISIKHFGKKDGILSNYITFVHQKNDTIFVGTKNGVSVIFNKKLIRNLNENDGFKGSAVKNIFHDANGKLWVISDQEIMKMEKNKLACMISFNNENGERNIIDKSFFDDKTNDLWIASKNKVSIIDINDIKPNPKVFNTTLEKVIADGKVLKSQNFEIKLPYGTQSLSLIFSSVDRILFGNSSLYYKMNDDEWKKFTEPKTLEFYNLSPGIYNLQVKSVNENGYEVIFPHQISINAAYPFWLKWWFLLAVAIMFGALSSYFFYDYNRGKFNRKIEELRLQREIERERQRISRDLHDNMGAYTTNLIAQVDNLQVSEPEEKKQVAEVRENAEFIMSLLRQTIWVLDVKESSMENYMDGFKNYCHKYLGSHPEIEVEFFEEISNNRMVASPRAMSLFRILQEGLHNIVKHSEASLVTVTMISDEKIFFGIKDNGKGFNPKEIKSGNGLKNMQERAREIGFDFFITSDQSGTYIQIPEM